MYPFPTTVYQPEPAGDAGPDEIHLRLAIALAKLAIDNLRCQENVGRSAPELTASIVYLATDGVCEARYVLV